MTSTGKQRYFCPDCRKTYTWRCKINKLHQERVWFELWLKEGYSLRQLTGQSGWSQSKLKRLKTYWLAQEPSTTKVNLSEYQNLIFDGTYFHHDCCLLVFYVQGKVIAYRYGIKEDYLLSVKWFRELKKAGLLPVSITMDGNTQIIRAIKETWPNCVVQRCLYHIKHQGEKWLRRYPRTDLAKDLKKVLSSLCSIRTVQDKEQFIISFTCWLVYYQTQIKLLRSKDKVESDIIRGYRLVQNALPDMFHYLDNPAISKTSNGLEGYFSHLKKHYRQHAGLTANHLQNYLSWYIYFTNT